MLYHILLAFWEFAYIFIIMNNKQFIVHNWNFENDYNKF